MTGNTGKKRSATRGIIYGAVILMVLICSIFIAGCTTTTAKPVVKQNDTVRVNYTLWVKGTVVDSTANRTSLEFTLGNKTMIPGFEQAILGMAPGETKTVTIPADQAYGEWKKEYVVSLNRSQYPDLNPNVGDKIDYTLTNGQKGTVKVVNLTESEIVVDANHPLAGQDLTFEIHLVEIVTSG